MIAESDAKISIVVAVVLVLTALYDLRISAAIACVYLVIYAMLSLRKRRTTPPK